MRVSSVLLRQHLGWHFKRKWKLQGKKIITSTPAEEILKSYGKTIHNPEDVLYEKQPVQKVDVVGFMEPELLYNEDHPLYNKKPCFMLRDHSVVVEGLDQIKLLTKTVEKEDGLPSAVEYLIPAGNTPQWDTLIKRCIMSSHVFDATQEKLPRLHDPERPAWNFPRVYGITQSRRARLMASRLVQLCESLVGGASAQSALVEDGKVTVYVDKESDRIQFDLTVDLAHICSSPLQPLARADDTFNVSLPDIYPFSSNVTLELQNFYENKDLTFVNSGSPYHHINTVIIHFDETKVYNLYETPVSEKQILGRTLAKAFAVAAIQAKQRFGVDVKDLPEPVTVQCIQTDGKLFHFIVLQLNTLNLNGIDGVKNIMWSIPRVQLFKSCTYVKGKPVLEGYNPEVFNRLLAFYKHSLQL